MSKNSAKDLSLHISPWQLNGCTDSNYDVAPHFLQHHCTSGPVMYSQSPLLGTFPVSLSVVSGCSFGKGIQKCGKWLWPSCKGLSGVSCGTEVQQQQPGQINCCRVAVLLAVLQPSAWLLREPTQVASWDGNDSCFFTNWIFCSLVDWNCSAKDEFIVKHEHMWSQRGGNSPTLFQLLSLSLSIHLYLD